MISLGQGCESLVMPFGVRDPEEISKSAFFLRFQRRNVPYDSKMHSLVECIARGQYRESEICLRPEQSLWILAKHLRVAMQYQGCLVERPNGNRAANRHPMCPLANRSRAFGLAQHLNR